MTTSFKWIAAALGLVLLLYGRTFYESGRWYKAASAKEASGEFEKAILLYDRAAHWYSPGNFYVGRSLDRLVAIGKKLEAPTPALSLLAYDSARGSIYAIRGFSAPHSERLPAINERIADLRGREQGTREYHARLLARDERPKRTWMIVVQLSFWGWVASVVGLIWFGFDPAGRMNGKKSLGWIGGIILGFGVWVLSLVRA